MLETYYDIDKMMEVLIERTKVIVNDVYRCHKEEEPGVTSNMTSLVFPQYSVGDDKSQGKQQKKEKTRISEQELRFAFVQAFHEYKCKHHCSYLYGVEVPTKDKYLFTEEVEVDNGKKRREYKPRIDSNGRSGSFDMVIYNDRFERVCLIEFKYDHPEAGSFAKDFLKLSNPNEGAEGAKRYFIHLLNDRNNRHIDPKVEVGNKFPKIDTSNIVYNKVQLKIEQIR